MFRTDGSTVTQVSNIENSQSTTDDPFSLYTYRSYAIFQNMLYFDAHNSNGQPKLFKTDGTTVTQVSNTRGNNSAGDTPTYFTEFQGELYFRASHGAWKIDMPGVLLPITLLTYVYQVSLDLVV